MKMITFKFLQNYYIERQEIGILLMILKNIVLIKKNTLTIIQLSDGKILGGYTSLPQNNNSNVCTDSESFLFNQYAKYPKRIKDIQSIIC